MDGHSVFCSVCPGSKSYRCGTSKLNAGPLDWAGSGRWAEHPYQELTLSKLSHQNWTKGRHLCHVLSSNVQRSGTHRHSDVEERSSGTWKFDFGFDIKYGELFMWNSSHWQVMSEYIQERLRWIFIMNHVLILKQWTDSIQEANQDDEFHWQITMNLPQKSRTSWDEVLNMTKEKSE